MHTNNTATDLLQTIISLVWLFFFFLIVTLVSEENLRADHRPSKAHSH